MRILVTGSRDWSDWNTLSRALNEYVNESNIVIIHGDCPTGADAMAQEWAEKQGVRFERHPADWEGPCRDTCRPGHRRGGKCPAAGPYRNQDMVDLGADVCTAFPLPGSRGTADCMRRAKDAAIPVRVYEPAVSSVSSP